MHCANYPLVFVPLSPSSKLTVITEWCTACHTESYDPTVLYTLSIDFVSTKPFSYNRPRNKINTIHYIGKGRLRVFISTGSCITIILLSNIKVAATLLSDLAYIHCVQTTTAILQHLTSLDLCILCSRKWMVGNDRCQPLRQSKIQSKSQSTVQSMSLVQSPESRYCINP